MKRIIVKRLYLMLLVLSVTVLLTACGGNVRHVKVVDWETSEIYTDPDIQAAVETVKRHFSQGFEGCTLLEISYPGDGLADEFEAWAKQYKADQAIVLYSSFRVGASGGDGSLNPNSTYRNWKWILVRTEGGKWEHKTHGYG